jgi:hypothetical protein
MSRDEPDPTAPERQILQDLLDDNRQGLLECVEGLTEQQARTRLVPSLTTPLALIKHAAHAEKVWFHVTLPGRTRAEVGVAETIDESFVLDESDTIESLVAAFRETCAESDRIAAAYELDDAGEHSRLGPVSLRWMYVHMIQELARHAGHGDILREQLLAPES